MRRALVPLCLLGLLAACAAARPPAPARPPVRVPDVVTHAPIRRAPACRVPRAAAPGPADVVVTPALGGWAAVRARVTPATRQILLAPGDYAAWGALELGPTWPSGAPGAPRVLRYFDPDAPAADAPHPVDRRTPATEAVVHGVLVWGGVHDWVIHGLTLRAPAPSVANGMLHVLGPAARVVIDGNLVEASAQSYGVRVRDSVDVCVQRNVIRDATNPTNDNVGIDIKPSAAEIRGLRVAGNEVSDWIDAVQVTNQGPLRVQFQIVGNDLFTTPARHVRNPVTGVTYGCTENAIDLKAPTAGTSYIVNNRMWGWRETPPRALATLCGAGFGSGSAGDAITIHIDATDVVIADNDFSDSVAALRAANRPGGRRLIFTRNRLRGIPAAGASTRFYGGAALVLEDDARVDGNVFDGVPLLCPRHGFPYKTWPPAGYSPAPPRISRNLRRGGLDPGACSAAIVADWADWPPRR